MQTAFPRIVKNAMAEVLELVYIDTNVVISKRTKASFYPC